MEVMQEAGVAPPPPISSAWGPGTSEPGRAKHWGFCGGGRTASKAPL
jgi:hypothetical protein